jgi:predicted deacylase
LPSRALAGERMLAAGTRFETPVASLEGPLRGPTVLVVAGIHGNERAGPQAARALLGSTLRKGRLVVVPEANRPALDKRSRFMPGEPHADLNRNFPVAGGDEPRGELARALWQLVVDERPDWVIDLHEGWGYTASSQSMGSSVVRARHPQTDEATLRSAERAIAAANEIVTDRRKRFERIEPGPAGSFARSIVERLAIPALVLETTWVEELERRVGLHERMLRAVLGELVL